jgi:hypothetical protein
LYRFKLDNNNLSPCITCAIYRALQHLALYVAQVMQGDKLLLSSLKRYNNILSYNKLSHNITWVI